MQMVIRQRPRDQEVMIYVPASRCGLERASPAGISVTVGSPFFKGKHTLALVKTGKRLCDSATPVVHQGKLPTYTPGAKDPSCYWSSNILGEHFTMLKSKPSGKPVTGTAGHAGALHFLEGCRADQLC